MRLSEITQIDEMQIGSVMPNVSTVDKSAPWIANNIDKAAEFTKAMNSAESDKKRFDMVLKAIKQNKSISIACGITLSRVLSYDVESGLLTAIDRPPNDTLSKDIVTNTYDTNDVVYNGRSKDLQGRKKYSFSLGEPISSESNPNPLYKKRETNYKGAAYKDLQKEKEKNKVSTDVFKAWGE